MYNLTIYNKDGTEYFVGLVYFADVFEINSIKYLRYLDTDKRECFINLDTIKGSICVPVR